MRKYNIKTNTEAYHPQQNPAERTVQDLKAVAKMIMDRSRADEKAWNKAMEYVCYISN